MAPNEESEPEDFWISRARKKHVQYIDVASSMLDPEGKLRADLFVEDGLHPTPKCYALWTSIIKPILLQRFGPAVKSAREIKEPYHRESIYNRPCAFFKQDRSKTPSRSKRLFERNTRLV